MDLIGKKCMYRPLYQVEMKTATVVAVQELVNLAGKDLNLAEMDNGDVVAANALYFFKSSTASAERAASIVFREFLTRAKITPRMAHKLSGALILEEQGNKIEKEVCSSSTLSTET